MQMSFVSRQSIVSSFLLCDAYYWSFLAEALRFWDWAADDVVTVGIPDALSNDSIEILDPTDSDGTAQTSIANPLSFYLFPSIPPSFKAVTYQDDNDVRTHNSLSLLEYFLCTPCVTIDHNHLTPMLQKTQTAYFDQWTKTLRHAKSSPSANESNTVELNQSVVIGIYSSFY